MASTSGPTSGPSLSRPIMAGSATVNGACLISSDSCRRSGGGSISSAGRAVRRGSPGKITATICSAISRAARKKQEGTVISTGLSGAASRRASISSIPPQNREDGRGEKHPFQKTTSRSSSASFSPKHSRVSSTFGAAGRSSIWSETTIDETSRGAKGRARVGQVQRNAVTSSTTRK